VKLKPRFFSNSPEDWPENWTVILAGVIPYAIILVIFVMFAVTAGLDRSDLALRGLVIAIPVLIAAFICLRIRDRLKQATTFSSRRLNLNGRHFSYLATSFFILFIFSISLLIWQETRPLTYFVLVSLMAGMVFLEILATGERDSFRRNLILFQVILIAWNLGVGQTFKFPLYFGGTDILPHMGYIDSLITGEHISANMRDYEDFPLFHIFCASGALLTNIGTKTSYFLFAGISFGILIPIVYLLLKAATRNAKISLLGTLILVLCRPIMYEASYTITRTIAGIICLLLLYLLLRGRGGLKVRTLAVVLIAPLVLLHQTSLVYTLGLMVVIYILDLIFHRRTQYITVTYLILFGSAFIAYWIYAADGFFSSMITTLVATSEPVMVPTKMPEQGSILLAFPRNIDYIIIIALSIIGVVGQLYESRRQSKLWTIFSILALVSVPLYFLPGPISFLTPIFLVYRIPFFIAPFVAFAAAVGILKLIEPQAENPQSLKSVITIGSGMTIIICLCLSTSALLGTQTDFDFNRTIAQENRKYFTNNELNAFDFTETYGIDMTIHSDYFSERYFYGLTDFHTTSTVSPLHKESMREGYFLFRKKELKSRDQLKFPIQTGAGFMGKSVVYRPTDTPEIKTLWEPEIKLYDSGEAQLYFYQHSY